MTTLSLLLATALFAVAISAASIPQIERSRNDLSITQRVDNFDPQNLATFEQYYMQFGQFYQQGGPLIVWIGGEIYAYEYHVTRALPIDIARETNGFLFHLDHRFYGKSYPTEDLSTENLRFLTIDQVLADVAHFIAHIRTVIPGATNAPVIVTGRGYGGSLAVWFRQRYPHLALAAYASSAPVLGRLNHAEYRELAHETLRSLTGDACFTLMSTATRHLEQLASTRRFHVLNRVFDICPGYEVRNMDDVALLLGTAHNVLTNFTQSRPLLEEACRLTTANNVTFLYGFTAAVQHVNGGQCWNLNYDKVVAGLQNVSISGELAEAGYRVRLYQQCSQLGGFRTSESLNQSFDQLHTLEFYTRLCEAAFGAEFGARQNVQAAVDRLNVAHGGLRPRASNVVYTHGLQDSQRLLNVREVHENDEQVVSLFLSVGAEASEYYLIDEAADSKELLQTKRTIIAQIVEWLQDE